MNFGKRSELARWAVATVVAAGGVTLVASDGSAVITMTLQVLGTADPGGDCFVGNNAKMFAVAQAFNQNAVRMCDVNTPISAGSTNSAYSQCPSAFQGRPTFIWALVQNINMMTGDVSATVCSAPNWSIYPNSSSCSGWFGSCHAAATAVPHE